MTKTPTGTGKGADAGDGGHDLCGGPLRDGRTSQDEAMHPGMAGQLSTIARELQTEHDSQAVMQRIVNTAVTEIPGATDAAVILLAHGKISAPVHTGTVATWVGEAETRTCEGPCVDTSRTAVTIRADDLRTDSRWPNFAPIAVRNGVLSIMSFQLFVQRASMGTLDVYANTANAFDDEGENIGLLLAAQAAIAMSATTTITGLRIALQTRDLIGQAKGILMERYRLNATQAFDLLVTASQRRNCRLRNIAEELTTTGEAPGIGEPPQPRSR